MPWFTLDRKIFPGISRLQIPQSGSSRGRNWFTCCTAKRDLKREINQKDFWAEEMIKTYIKQIIISATRTLIKSNNDSQIISYDKELARKFSQLVELHYRNHHNVSDYANMLNITPKNLNKKIVSEKQVAPSIIIKQRIILQAKRLLANTTLSIKEIADYLGYEDYSYFVRFFKSQTGLPPLSFRNAL